MPIVPLYGHRELLARLTRSAGRGALPASLLLHGPRGVGKQRLALELAGELLCRAASAGATACGQCESCRHARELSHPDLLWFFPRPRLKTPDPAPADVLEDYAEAVNERRSAHGLYPPASGSDGLFVATIRTIVRQALLRPIRGSSRVILVGDAERMVPQEGADMAANAFLKLLEEPPRGSCIILTSSEPGALLATIRSRVVAVQVAGLGDHEVAAFVEDPRVAERLDELGVPSGSAARVALAAGAPGALLAGSETAAATGAARALLEAAEGTTALRYAAALAQGAASARGSFTGTLGALNVLLRDSARDAVERGDTRRAYGMSRAMSSVATAHDRAGGNVNPQLITAQLLRELGECLR